MNAGMFLAPVPPVPPAPPACALDELTAQYRDHGLYVRAKAADTVAEELLYLRHFFLYLGSPSTSAELYAGITPRKIDVFLRDFGATHAVGARRWEQLALRSFLRFSYFSDYLPQDLSGFVPTVRYVRMGRVARALPDVCIATLEAGIDRQTPAGLRDAAMVSLLNGYGVRGAQIRRLHLEHIDWENGRIVFPAAKGGRPVEQALTAWAGNRLVDYLQRGRPSSPCPEVFLTLTEPFRPLPSASYLSKIIRTRIGQLRLAVPEGVSRGTHGFRHAFATRLIGKIPFKDLVDLLGHRTPSSTLIYGKVDVDSLRQAALPWPGGEP